MSVPPALPEGQYPLRLLYEADDQDLSGLPPLAWRGLRCGTDDNPGMVFPFVPECEPEQGEGNWP